MGDPEAAIRLLRNGLEEGMWWARNLARDSDLEAARETGEFGDLFSESERRWAAACPQIQPIVRVHAPTDGLGPLLVVAARLDRR